MAKQSLPISQSDVSAIEGHSVERILEFATKLRVDLVVLGSQGECLSKRLFIGSASEKMLKHAPCSVLSARRAAIRNILALSSVGDRLRRRRETIHERQFRIFRHLDVSLSREVRRFDS